MDAVASHFQALALRCRHDAGLFFKSVRGTQHRDQITAVLTALGLPCPDLDLVHMLQQETPRP